MDGFSVKWNMLQTEVSEYALHLQKVTNSLFLFFLIFNFLN